MKCGICGLDKNPNGTPLRDLSQHKRREHPREWKDQRQRSVATRRANAKSRQQEKDIERNAKVEGREAVSMPVVKRYRHQGLVQYEVNMTSDIAWSTYSSGELNTYYEYRLLDLGPQASYMGMQNQIDSLLAAQQSLLEQAFEQGPEVTQEHLEAVAAAGERAVERLRAE